MRKLDTKKLAVATLLGALAGASEAIKGPPFDIPFPLMPGVISWDLTGIPIMISLFFNGLVGGIYTSIIGCSIIFIRGNVVGGIFKLLAELSTLLAFAASHKSVVNKSIAAISSRVFVMTVISYKLLPIVYPFFYPSEARVIGILLPLAVFNITQALLNIIPAYIIDSRLPNRWRLDKNNPNL